MRVLPWILVGVLAVLCVLGWLRPRGTVTTTEYVSDTVVVRDTVRDTVPRYVSVATVRRDTLLVPLPADTVRDSIPVIIPIERKEYRTADYRAVVSGYKPSLDYMEVYRKTQTVTLSPKPKRWGIGLQAGISYPAGWHVGIGISYDIWQW